MTANPRHRTADATWFLECTRPRQISRPKRRGSRCQLHSPPQSSRVGPAGMGIATPLESVRTWVRLNALLASMQLGLRESDRQSRKVRRPKAQTRSGLRNQQELRPLVQPLPCGQIRRTGSTGRLCLSRELRHRNGASGGEPRSRRPGEVSSYQAIRQARGGRGCYRVLRKRSTRLPDGCRHLGRWGHQGRTRVCKGTEKATVKGVI